MFVASFSFNDVNSTTAALQMKALFLTFLLAVCSAFVVAAPADVSLIGHYDNITTSNKLDPHQYGYGMDLYRRSDGTVFGNFVFAPGTTEGFGAALYDINMSADRKYISFKARLSSGSESYFGGYRKSRDAFVFDGTISDRYIAGALVLKSGYDLSAKGTTTQVKLKRDRSKLNGSFVPSSYGDWLAQLPPPADW